MKIDFRNCKISCFSDKTGYKEHVPLFTTFTYIEVLDNGRILVCEDYHNLIDNGITNLYCLNRSLEIDWYLPLPFKSSEVDFYVGFTSYDNNVFANTWSCHRVGVDVDAGLITSVEFTK